MADPTAGARKADFTALIVELAKFRDERLNREPSDRTLAKAAAVSPTTIGAWLRGDSFPQQTGQLLKLLRAVRGRAEATGLIHNVEVAALLDLDRWRLAHEAEARQRADGTRAAVQAQQGRAVLERMQPGWPLEEVSDPFQLEVHHAIEAEGESTNLPILPLYVRRDHDRLLDAVVEQAAAGTSRIAVLVGGSSTGKTRACWEALRPLREQQGWRLWHPIDPTRPDAALADLAHVGPRTVVWLNEAQFYLDGALGERVAAGLRELLRDPRRAPMLVLATLWPTHWDTLTTRTSPDVHAQARELLDGQKIKVPDAFTGSDLNALIDQAADDPRLSEAAEHVQDGQITQYLAGVPVLMDRYQEASPATRALIHAAMDARRLGCGPRLPLALLANAAPGYLTDAQWDQTDDDWLQQALSYVAAACNGIPGILTPIKSGADRNRRLRSASPPAQAGSGSLYRLADYLDQHGRRHRADQIPPIDFWTAAAHAHPGDLTALGEAAWDRGLYRDAAQLCKHATAHGDAKAASNLVRRLHDLQSADYRPAHWAVIHANLDDPYAVTSLLNALRAAGADDQVAALLARDPATHANLDDPFAVTSLLDALRAAGAGEQVATLAKRAVTHANIDDPLAVGPLLNALRAAGADDQVAALLARDPATRVNLDGPLTVASLLDALRAAGADDQVAALLARDPATHANLDDPFAVGPLLSALRAAGADDQVAALLAREPATHANFDDPLAVASLLNALRAAGADDQVAALLARDPATHTSLNNSLAMELLPDVLLAVGAGDQVATLAKRAVTHTNLNDSLAVATLLNALRRIGAHDQVVALLARDPATHANLNDPFDVGELLDALLGAKAGDQFAILANRLVAHVNLNGSPTIGKLLNVLQKAGYSDHIAHLAGRLPAAGHFYQFIQIGDHGKRFKFGREPDGSAAPPWTWDDLE